MNSQLSSIRADGGRLAIHPLEVVGRFMTARRITFAILVGVYVAAPSIHIGGHPAVHLDVQNRRFYLLGDTFNAQDFWMVVLGLTAFMFGILFVTAWRGRLWCGWACPQTVFLEGIFRPIERWFDGPSSARIRRRGEPWTPVRVLRAVGKHLAYFAVAMALAHVATSLFVSMHDLTGMVSDGPSRHWEAFTWTAAFTLGLYFNFAWFREQFCVVMCPYGRLQSVLHDSHSITVAYDARRGEPRGKLGATSGDCVDCNKCVQACPTAIDIRNGLQMECVACAQCIDACDDVMTRIQKPKGLIRYASQSALRGEKQKVLRPRLLLYAVLTLVSSSALVISLWQRTPFEANVLRMRGVPFVIEDGQVRNQYEVHLVNKSPSATRYRLGVTGHDALTVDFARSEVTVESLQDSRVPMVVKLPVGLAHGKVDLQLQVTDSSSGESRITSVPFIAP